MADIALRFIMLLSIPTVIIIKRSLLLPETYRISIYLTIEQRYVHSTYTEKMICSSNNLVRKEWKLLRFKRVIFISKNIKKYPKKSNLSIYCKIFKLPLLTQTCQFCGKYAEFF